MRAAWFFTIDDAYITFRYSLNLANGDGAVWNVGEDPVEGFTNFLWMVWHTPFVWLGIGLPTVAKLTSLAAGALALAMLVRYSWQRFGTLSALVAGGAFVVFLPTYFHLTGGLETVAFAALVLRIVIIALHTNDGRDTRTWELPLLVVLAGMLRPEGVLAAAPAFLCWIWAHRTNRRARLHTGAAVILGLGYFLWRYLYYGHLFPNTFYVKFGNLDAGTTWLQTTAPALAPLLVLTLLLVARKQTRTAGVLLTATVATTYITYFVSGPSMDYVHRFAFHAYPLLCLGAGLAAGALRPRLLAAGAGAVAVGWVAVTGVQPADLPTVVNYGPDLQRAHVAIGKGLANADIPTEHRTVALHDAGATPYYSGWNTIDYIGLNDEPIAHGADPTARVTNTRPTVFIVRGLTRAVPASAYLVDITQATQGYEHLATIPMRANYHMHVFARPEWADHIRGPLLTETNHAQRTYDPGRLELTFDRWLDRLRNELPW
ncbi:hypothetical protein GCM10027436_57670 [Actinophytocola sediminis]